MESNTTVLNSCFNLMRRLSPNDIKKNVAGLAALIQNEDLRYEVIQKIDQPLGMKTFCKSDNNFPFIESEFDTVANQYYLKCEYNRDGDSYRSPWSNKYFPPRSDDAVYPSNEILGMEQKANDVFQRYAQLYFDSA